MSDPNLLFTMAQAARRKGVSYQSVYKAVRDGKLPTQRLGRQRLVTGEDLDAWQHAFAARDEITVQPTSGIARLVALLVPLATMTLRVPSMRQRPTACRLGAAARLRVFEPIRAGVTALVAWATRDLIGARHTMGDHVLGELVIGYGWFRGRYTLREHRADPSPRRSRRERNE